MFRVGQVDERWQKELFFIHSTKTISPSKASMIFRSDISSGFLAKLYPPRAPRRDLTRPAVRKEITIKLKYFSDISSMKAIFFKKTGLFP